MPGPVADLIGKGLRGEALTAAVMDALGLVSEATARLYVGLVQGTTGGDLRQLDKQGVEILREPMPLARLMRLYGLTADDVKAWREELHPRVPGGEHGGEFTSRPGAAVVEAVSDAMRGIKLAQVRPEVVERAEEIRSKPGQGSRTTRTTKPTYTWLNRRASALPTVAETGRGALVRLPDGDEVWVRENNVTANADGTVTVQRYKYPGGMEDLVLDPDDEVKVGAPKPGVRDALLIQAREFFGDNAEGRPDDELLEEYDRATAAGFMRLTSTLHPVAIRVRMDALRGVLDGGIVPNVGTRHAGDERGDSYQESRWELEKKLWSIDSDDPVDHPNYGYMTDFDEKLDKAAARAWGDVRLVLNPEVRARTTVMYSDSGYVTEYGNQGDTVPWPLDGDPDKAHLAVSSFQNLRGVEEAVPRVGLDKRPLEDMLSPEKLAEIKAEMARFSHWDEPSKEQKWHELLDDAGYYPWRHGDFIEAQIHGGISLDDVAEINFELEPPDDVKERLRDASISWSVYESEEEAKAAAPVTDEERERFEELVEQALAEVLARAVEMGRKDWRTQPRDPGGEGGGRWVRGPGAGAVEELAEEAEEILDDGPLAKALDRVWQLKTPKMTETELDAVDAYRSIVDFKLINDAARSGNYEGDLTEHVKYPKWEPGVEVYLAPSDVAEMSLHPESERSNPRFPHAVIVDASGVYGTSEPTVVVRHPDGSIETLPLVGGTRRPRLLPTPSAMSVGVAIQALDELIERSPEIGTRAKLNLFRGVTDMTQLWGEDGPQVGERFTEKSFMSTTTKEEVAAGYAGGASRGQIVFPGVIEIVAPADTKGAWMRLIPTGSDRGNNEFVLPRDVTLEVTGIEKRNWAYWDLSNEFYRRHPDETVVLARIVEVAGVEKKVWREELHPRDTEGQFARKPFGGAPIRKWTDMEIADHLWFGRAARDMDWPGELPEKGSRNRRAYEKARARARETFKPKNKPLRSKLKLERGASPEDRARNKVVVAGPVTTKQWMKRTESMWRDVGHMDDEQIEEFARWYDDFAPAFRLAFGDRAETVGRAWIIANANQSPEGAVGTLMTVLEGEEQPDRPERSVGLFMEEMEGLLHGEQADAFAEAKLTDFGDALLGREGRSYYGDAPEFGPPVVADVWAHRDAGYIDQHWMGTERTNVTLGRLVDLETVEADEKSLPGNLGRYEMTAKFYQDMVPTLNEQKFLGRDDWTANQAQAVGWGAMHFLYGQHGLAIWQGMQRQSTFVNLPQGDAHGDLPPLDDMPPDVSEAISEAGFREVLPEIASEIGVEILGVGYGPEPENGGMAPFAQAQVLGTPEGVALFLDSVAAVTGRDGPIRTTKLGTSGLGGAQTIKRIGKADSKQALVVEHEKLEDPAVMAAFWNAIKDAKSTEGKRKKGVEHFEPLKYQTLDGKTHHGVMVIIPPAGGANKADRIKNAQGNYRDAVEAALDQVGIEPEEVSFHADYAQIRQREGDFEARAKRVAAADASFAERLASEYEPRFRQAIRESAAEHLGETYTTWAANKLGHVANGIVEAREGLYVAPEKRFDPNQERWPRGTPRGGEWRGDVAVAEPDWEDFFLEPQPEFPSIPGWAEMTSEEQTAAATTEEMSARIEAYRAGKTKWTRSIERALSLGRLNFEQAEERGYRPVGHQNRETFLELGRPAGGWQAMPPRLYHVTTARSAVETGRLMSRAELGQSRGMGLGGGDDESISFTTDRELAESMTVTMKEARKVARLEITAQDLLDMAEKGQGSTRPFKTALVRSFGTNREWNPGDPYSPDLQSLLAGRKNERVGIPKTLEEFKKQRREHLQQEYIQRAISIGGMTPEDPEAWVGDIPWEQGTRPGLFLSFTRPMSHDEQAEATFDLYKYFLTWREEAGGSENPLFFSSDALGLARVPEDEIAMLEFRPRHGAQGYPLSPGGLSEWRTHTGEAVELVTPKRKKSWAGRPFFKDFNPRQPRWPRGSPRGGEWRGETDVEVDIAEAVSFARAARTISGMLSEPDGGFTMTPILQEANPRRYVIALKGGERKLTAEGATPDAIYRYALDMRPMTRESERYLGGWHDPEDGSIYLDVSTSLDSLDGALQLGRENGQLAIFDTETFSSIRVDGEKAMDDLERFERRMRAQLANIVTVDTEALANIPDLDSLTDEQRAQVEAELEGDASKAYDPHQRRWPEGTPLGGQWRSTAGMGFPFEITDQPAVEGEIDKDELRSATRAMKDQIDERGYAASSRLEAHWRMASFMLDHLYAGRPDWADPQTSWSVHDKEGRLSAALTVTESKKRYGSLYGSLLFAVPPGVPGHLPGAGTRLMLAAAQKIVDTNKPLWGNALPTNHRFYERLGAYAVDEGHDEWKITVTPGAAKRFLEREP